VNRSNHYELAFEAYLRERKLCFIAVSESRRSLLDEGSVKSLDFIVHGTGEARLLVDVKGRRFPGTCRGKPRWTWETWTMSDDAAGLEQWVERFGPGFVGLLVFMYDLGPEVELPADVEDLWEFRGKRYLLRAVDISDYRRHLRVRSPRWGTVHLPRSVFQSIVRPFRAFAEPVAEPSVAAAPDPF
jgi:hypothetical protein